MVDMNDMDETQPIGSATPDGPAAPDVSGSAAPDKQVSGALAPPATPPPPPTTPPDQAGESAQGPRTGLRERVLGLRAVAAVALASLVLGGVGGTALGALSDGEDSNQGGPGGRQFAPGQRGQVPADGQVQDDQLQDDQVPDLLPDGGFQRQAPGGPPGQLPPGTAPEGDVAPDANAGGTQGGITT